MVCGKMGAKLAECDFCPRAIHIECMEPPMSRVPKKWSCAMCIQRKVFMSLTSMWGNRKLEGKIFSSYEGVVTSRGRLGFSGKYRIFEAGRDFYCQDG